MKIIDCKKALTMPPLLGKAGCQVPVSSGILTWNKIVNSLVTDVIYYSLVLQVDIFTTKTPPMFEVLYSSGQ